MKARPRGFSRQPRGALGLGSRFLLRVTYRNRWRPCLIPLSLDKLFPSTHTLGAARSSAIARPRPTLAGYSSNAFPEASKPMLRPFPMAPRNSSATLFERDEVAIGSKANSAVRQLSFLRRKRVGTKQSSVTGNPPRPGRGQKRMSIRPAAPPST